MAEYRCKDCNYRFESQIHRKDRKCPYCGKDSVIPEPNVDQLLMDE